MVKFLINRPVAVFMATFAFLLLGIVAGLRIPTSLMPDIAIPQITVQVSYPNNTARELETNIVRTLRNRLLQVANLKNIETQTQDGFAVLNLFFEYGTDTHFAFIETNEKIDGALNYLPKDLDRPKVIKASATDIPILNLTVSLKNTYSDERFLQLSDFAQTVLKKRIEQLPDIALADISGQTNPEIIITPNSNKIQSLNISNNQLVEAIKQNNFELGNLIVNNGIYQYNFKFSNPLKSKHNIENIYLNIHNKLFKIKELAKVTLQPQQDKGMVYYNGKRAVTLAIIKQADARVYNLKNKLQELTQSFKKDYPDLEFNTNQDQTTLLQVSINNLKTSLLIGSLLAILIMFFFLKDVKSPLIIAISIPVSLIVSVFLMYVSGLSINIISLSGLILGVGMMIDNSIIVIDNITQKLETGKPLQQACIEGTNEIITPLISSVLTTCSVFLPLLFLSGITGALFYDQAIAVSIGLGASLLVSILIIPVLYKQLKSKNLTVEKWFNLNLKTQHIELWYIKGYNYFFTKKWIIYSISVLSILIAVFLFKTMEYSQLPEIKQNETLLTLDWNQNIHVEENKNRIKKLFDSTNDLISRYSLIGEQDFILQQENMSNSSEAMIYLKSNSVASLEKIKTHLTKKIKTNYPESNFSFEKPKNIFQYIFGTNQAKLIAQVYSKKTTEVPGEEKLPEIVSLLGNKNTSSIPLKQTLFIKLIPENITLYQVNYQDLINELKTTFNQNFIDDLKTSKKFIPIKLSYSKKSFDEQIRNLFVKNRENTYIPVSSLIKIVSKQQYKTIVANRQGEYLSYNLNTKNSVNNQISNLQEKFDNTQDYTLRFSGNWINMIKLRKELLGVIVIAVLLLYFIMAAQFESLWQPLIILLEIPIDIGGALLLLWLFGQTINIMAIIGIVVMSGVIINDSILKIHTINLLRKQGIPVSQAIKQAGTLRLKPILMTSLTTILALLPFLFISGLGAELQKPLALTVIGGMILGTFISLYFIPLVYFNVSQIFIKSTQNV